MRELCHLVVWVSFFVGSQVQRILDFGMLSFFAFQSANKNIWPTSRPPRNSMGIRRPFWLVQCGPPVFCPGPFGAGPFLSGWEVWILVHQEKDMYSFLQLTFCLAEHFWDAKVEMYWFHQVPDLFFFAGGRAWKDFPWDGSESRFESCCFLDLQDGWQFYLMSRHLWACLWLDTQALCYQPAFMIQVHDVHAFHSGSLSSFVWVKRLHVNPNRQFDPVFHGRNFILKTESFTFFC